MANTINQVTPASSLLVNRIIWGALIMGQVAFMSAQMIILRQPQNGARPPISADMLMVFVIVNAVMLATIIPVTFFIRSLIFKRARNAEGVIPPQAFSTGNIIFWAGCEGCSLFGLVVAFLNYSFWPTIVFVAIALACQVATFPRRSQIEPADQMFKIT